LIGGTEATGQVPEEDAVTPNPSCLPDLEDAEAAVLNSLNSVDAKRLVATPSMLTLRATLQALMRRMHFPPAH